jgi:hypothetical protein
MNWGMTLRYIFSTASLKKKGESGRAPAREKERERERERECNMNTWFLQCHIIFF